MPAQSLRVLTPPTEEPVDVATFKAHCRIDTTVDDDVLIPAYLTTARQIAEDYLGRTLIATSFQWNVRPDRRGGLGFDPSITAADGLALGWGASWARSSTRELEIPRAPLISLDGVTMRDATGADIAISSDYYVLSAPLDPAKLRINFPKVVADGLATWPIEYLTIDFTAGYGTSPGDVPQKIVTAIMMQAAHLYEHRGDDATELSIVARGLLNPYRVAWF